MSEIIIVADDKCLKRILRNDIGLIQLFHDQLIGQVIVSRVGVIAVAVFGLEKDMTIDAGDVADTGLELFSVFAA